MRRDIIREWSADALADAWQKSLVSEYNPSSVTVDVRGGRDMVGDQVDLVMAENLGDMGTMASILSNHGIDELSDFNPHVPLYRQSMYQRIPRAKKTAARSRSRSRSRS